MEKDASILKGMPHMLHGGDYNPDQWLPWKDDIWPEDMRIGKLAHCNAMSVGIFSWTNLEPEEGVFTFAWLDELMDMLAANGMKAILATPSGARPAWMSQKYPEVLRVRADRGRNLHGERHNHCMSSPVYREKVRILNTKLAERYAGHPALAMWHVSNEYSGECHCPLCQEKFRAFLRAKYGTLDALNRAYWTAFWSHTYTDWAQLEPPSPIGETGVHGLVLDWLRFTTEQTVDFYLQEIAPLKAITPDIPCTANLMGTFPGIDYFRLAEVLDVVSWDNYPQWRNGPEDAQVAAFSAFSHDVMRGCGAQKPWLLMESSPSATNWRPVAKLHRPGVHLLSSMQAVAHGSDSVLYFQFRKGRGACEKFHGAVIDHVGHEHTRVFEDVQEVGRALTRLDDVVGTRVESRVALMFDTQNRWAIEQCKGMLNEGKGYLDTAVAHYTAFWKRGVPVDIVNETADISTYDVLVAPMLYMLRPGVAERIDAFVQGGGTLVTTYATGYVDENDLCFLGGFPGPLQDTLGIWCEEIDALYPGDENAVLWNGQSYRASGLCELIHARGAQVLATYEQDFYAGRPALTLHRRGQGSAYYMAARCEQTFLDDFYESLLQGLDIPGVLPGTLPQGVSACARTDGEEEFVFLMNFLGKDVRVDAGRGGVDMLTGDVLSGRVTLPGHGLRVFRREKL